MIITRRGDQEEHRKKRKEKLPTELITWTLWPILAHGFPGSISDRAFSQQTLAAYYRSIIDNNFLSVLYDGQADS